jgi:hypothetical protein
MAQAMLPTSTARLTACLLLFATAALSSCRQAGEANQQAAGNAADAVENAAPRVPLPKPPMDRAALLEAVARARSAAAAGLDDRQAQQALDGKAFEVRVRFGCGGAAKAGDKKASLSWSFDSESGVLRVRAAPDLSEEAAVANGLQGVEAVEGFWLPRPWLLDAVCPAKPEAPANAAAEGGAAAPAEPAPAILAAALPKVGIAQFFTAADPRTTRRDHRPYETVEKLEPAASVGAQGFDLVLSGRLRVLPEGRVVRCLASAPDAPPACVISAQFDHVWIDDAATRARIADWSSS